MNSPEEKAKELVEKFSYMDCDKHYDERCVCVHIAKEISLTCVDEIISIADNINSVNYSQTKMYWESVKEAINKL